MGKELEGSSGRQGNTRGYCGGHQQEETEISNSAKRRSGEGVQSLVASCDIHERKVFGGCMTSLKVLKSKEFRTTMLDPPNIVFSI